MAPDGVLSAAEISIHALREEGDNQGHGRGNTEFNFYPRPPRGGRLLSHQQLPET